MQKLVRNYLCICLNVIDGFCWLCRSDYRDEVIVEVVENEVIMEIQ